MSGPLTGLRVIDATDDSGRFATRLLTELGADVVRVETRGTSGAGFGDAALDARGGVLDWWYDGGKRRCALDLDSAAGQAGWRDLASRADLLIESQAPGRLAARRLDHEHLAALNPALVQVSITPFGRTGPRAHWQGSDLVCAALGGTLSVTGTAERPLNLWGRQSYNFAGFTAAIAGLAGVRAARIDGRGRHFDVSVHETVTTTIEHTQVYLFFDQELPEHPRVAVRQGALHWLKLYDLQRCRDGCLMITPTPDPARIIEWMVKCGQPGAQAFVGLEPEQLQERGPELMNVIRDFVRERPAMATWWEAQQRHNAMAAVHDIEAVADIPQYAHRGLFADVPADQARVRMPHRMVRFSATPVAPPRAPAAGDTDLAALLAQWGEPSKAATGARLARPLEGLRVADFTWVLAGPFCTRMLGDLGADVIRIQNEARSTSVNRPDYPYFFVWNRSKRSATLNMKHPDALAAARRLIENCDVLIENYSAGVMDRWGLDWDTVHAWNPKLVYVSMSGCGHDGPWRHVISYAPTVHALSGITWLTNFIEGGDVGPGYSLNDSLAGYAAAVTLLAALEHRDRTGQGQKIDMAQLEIGSYCIGPALIEHFAGGRPAPAGNRDGLHDHVPNEVYATRDGHLAISVTDDAQWPALAAMIGEPLAAPDLASETQRRAQRELVDAAIGRWAARQDAEDAMQRLQAAGVPAGRVQDAEALFSTDPQHRARGFWQRVEHAGFGPRPTDTFPALVDGQRLDVVRAAPAYLGEHNLEVWTDIAGLDAQAVVEGMANGLFE